MENGTAPLVEPRHRPLLIPAADRLSGAGRDALLRRMLALADFVAALVMCASFAVVASRPDAAAWSAILSPAALLIAKAYGLYDRDHRTLRHLTADELPHLVAWTSTCVLCTSLFLEVTPSRAPSLVAAAIVWAIGIATAAGLRAFTRFAWRRVIPADRVIVVGSGRLAAATRRKLELFQDIHARLIGESDEIGLDDLERTIEAHRIDRVIVATDPIDERLIAELFRCCRRSVVKLSVIHPAHRVLGTAVQLRHIAELPVIEYNTWDVSRSTLLLKRVMDVVLAALALAALAPLFILIAIAIKFDSKGPVFFVQDRGGVDGEPFAMLKFRTMVREAEEMLAELVPFDTLHEPMFKLAADPRVTRVGRFLRRSSLDEIPQLVNVLRGQMSLVGPRPEQVDLVARYRPEHRFRLDVKPGLTGPMQVFGRGGLTFDERLAVERDYIENLSVARDLRLILLTLSAVVAGKGAY